VDRADKVGARYVGLLTATDSSGRERIMVLYMQAEIPVVWYLQREGSENMHQSLASGSYRGCEKVALGSPNLWNFGQRSHVGEDSMVKALDFRRSIWMPASMVLLEILLVVQCDVRTVHWHPFAYSQSLTR
jgi:hypothetical protein